MGLWIQNSNFFAIFMWTILGHLSVIIPDLVIMNTALIRKHSLWLLLGVIESRLFLVYLGFDYLLGQTYRGTIWWAVIYFVLALFYNIVIFIAFSYTFEGSFHKIALAIIFGETIPVVFVNDVLAFLNLIITDGRMSNYYVAFDKVYFLLPILSNVFFFLCYYFVRPFLIKYRSYEVKYPKFVFALFTVYFTVGLFSGITDFPNGDMKTAEALIIKIFFLGTLSLLVCLYLFQSGVRGEQKENAVLKQKRELVMKQYQELQKQADSVSRRADMAKREKALLSRLDKEGRDDDEIREYLSELRGQYNAGMVGMYSDDLILDAIFCKYHELCAAKGVTDDFSAWDYRGKGDNSGLYYAVNGLLELGFEESSQQDDTKRFLFLHIATSANMSVIDFRCATNGIRRNKRRKFETAVKEAGGEFLWKPGENELRLAAMLRG